VIVVIAVGWAGDSDAVYAVRPTDDVSLQQSHVSRVCLLLGHRQCAASVLGICFVRARHRATDN